MYFSWWSVLIFFHMPDDHLISFQISFPVLFWVTSGSAQKLFLILCWVLLPEVFRGPCTAKNWTQAFAYKVCTPFIELSFWPDPCVIWEVSLQSPPQYFDGFSCLLLLLLLFCKSFIYLGYQSFVRFLRHVQGQHWTFGGKCAWNNWRHLFSTSKIYWTFRVKCLVVPEEQQN